MPESTIVKIEYEPGFIVTTDDGGRKTRHAIAPVVRAEDVPDLNITSMTLLTTLAQVVMLLVQTLVERDLLDEELVSGYDLQYVYDTLVDDLSVEEEC